MNQAPTYFTTTEVAKKLRVRPATVRDYIRRGLLEAIKIGRQYLISESAIQRFVER